MTDILAGHEYLRLIGCDDSTEIPMDDFTEEDRSTLDKLVKLSEQYSESGCMPRVSISKAVEKSNVYNRFYLGWEDE